ncbi:unnamed protein product [Somion occarium]|uniref:F-box domain-containing protein n=1 Tax=Somion occarium TaxID=3059160 RepID=A0ABP1CX29_9APHY
MSVTERNLLGEHDFLTGSPSDVILDIFCHLAIADLLAVRCTCRRLSWLSTLKVVWLEILQRDIVAHALPMPSYCLPLGMLSANQVECLVRHLYQVNRNMWRPSEPCHRAINLPSNRPITWVRLVLGQWVLIASSDISSSVISLWHLPSLLQPGRESTVSPVAQAFLDGPVEQGLVEVHHYHGITIALCLKKRIPCISVMTIENLGQTTAFRQLATITDASHLRFLHGSYIGVAFSQNISVSSVHNWRTGEIDYLQTIPDLKGGYIDMAARSNWIAAVSRMNLHIYMPDYTAGGRCKFWRGLNMPIAMSSACFNEAPVSVVPSGNGESEKLYLCIANHRGIHIYEVICRPLDDHLELIPVWTHNLGLVAQKYESLTIQPRFGASPHVITWLRDCVDLSFLPTFVAARIPTADSVVGAEDVIEISDPNLPSLYCQPVRDFDEARGVAIFGNAFGELALVDFSGVAGRSQEVLGSCFQPLSFPPSLGYDLLPTEPVHCVPAPPFPYCGGDLYDEHKEYLFELWREYEPENIPEGWDTDWELWGEWVCFVNGFQFDGIASLLENTYYYYGQVVPLLQRPDEYLIFEAGGLLFVLREQRLVPYVAYELIAPEQLAIMIDANDGLGSIPVTRIPKLDDTRHIELGNSVSRWEYERKHQKRNRWQELVDRGGKVHWSLLAKDIHYRPSKNSQ